MENEYHVSPLAKWAGEVPVVWKFYKSKYIFGERFEKGNDINLELLSPTQKYGVIPQSMYDELSGMRVVKVKEDTDLSSFKTVHTGDFCISLRSFQGGFEYSKYEGVVSPAYHIIFSKKPISDGYYKYLFKEQTFIAEMNSYCQSLRDGKNISYEDFGKTWIPYPPLSEQQAIADYLDDRCSKIDEIIAETTASIEEYKELKQAVIFEAVTKGLDKNVPMKDSGVEWIGEVPSHWVIKKFKYVASVNANLVSPDGYMDFQQIAPDCIEKDSGRLIKERTVSEAGVESWNQLFRKGQLIYSKIRPILNKVIIAPYDGLCSADMYPLDVVENIEFVQKAMLSRYFVDQVGLITQDRVKMPKINKEELANIHMAIPPHHEQIEIVKYLDIRMDEIDDIIDEKQSLIEDLQAYKKSLIYEVVTGKRRVV